MVSNVINYKISKHLGINRSGDQFNMSSQFAWLLLNCFSDVSRDGRGAIQQRVGTTNKSVSGALNSGNSKIRHMKEQAWRNGTSELICRGYNGWYRLISGGFVELDVSRTEDARGQSTSYDDYFIMVDGDGVARKSNSAHTISNLSLDATAPANPTAAHVHANRVFLNDPGTADFVGSKVSDPFSSDSFSKENDSIRVPLDLNLPTYDEPIAFITISDNLLGVIGTRYISIWNAPETATALTLIRYMEISPVSPQGFVNLGNDYGIVLKSGFNSLSSTEAYEQLRTDDVSGMVDPLWEEYIATQDELKDICGQLDTTRNHIYITFQDETTGVSRTLVYSLFLKTFVGVYQFPFMVYSWFEGLDGTMYMGADDGNIYALDDASYSDNGIAMRFEWVLPYLGTESPDTYKSPREAQIFADTNAPVTLNMNISFGLSESETFTYQFFIDAVVSKYRVSKYRVTKYRGSGKDLVLNPNLINRGRFIGVSVWHEELSRRVRIPYIYLRCLKEGDR